MIIHYNPDFNSMHVNLLFMIDHWNQSGLQNEIQN